MRKTLRILVPLVLLAAAVFAADNYVEFFARSPALVLAGCLIAFVAYLPSLWVARRLDRQPMRWAVYAAAFGFVVAFAPITSEVTWGVINRGVRYWQIVGLTEELTKMLPVLLALLYAPRLVRNTRDGLVLGALAGLGFAVIEFGTTFALDSFPENGWADLYSSLPARWALGTHDHILWGATTGGAIGYLTESPRSRKRIVVAALTIVVVILTHGLQDLYGKYIGPLAIGVVGGPLLAMGVTEEAFQPGRPLFSAVLFLGGLINTLLINALVIPILWQQIRRGPGCGSAP
jgi:RsiW-degrading membrane proteinase PrsW (M82 family)